MLVDLIACDARINGHHTSREEETYCPLTEGTRRTNHVGRLALTLLHTCYTGEVIAIQVQAEITALKTVLNSKGEQAATLRQNLGYSHSDHWRNGLRNLTESET